MFNKETLIGQLSPVIIITGHYGCGKTNFAINLALMAASLGKQVTLADLDIVNPYFRSSDFKDLASKNNIEMISPMYANSNVDLPAITPALGNKILSNDGIIIIDVGGDDAGAAALGRYTEMIKEYTMLYLVNANRYLTRTPEEAVEIMREIEFMGKFKATYIINNSNMSYETKESDMNLEYADKIAQISGIPLLGSCIVRGVYDKIDNKGDLIPVDIYVKTLWS